MLYFWIALSRLLHYIQRNSAASLFRCQRGPTLRSYWVLLCVFLLPACVLTAFADIGDNGQKCNTFGATCENPLQITAQSTGKITGNLYYFSADFNDYVRVIDTNPNNSWTSPWYLRNHDGVNQPSVTFGSALKGDVLVVQICDEELQGGLCTPGSKYLFGSDPADSHDGLNHALVSTIGGGTVSLQNQTQVWAIWLEDLDAVHDGDFDYNDEVVSLHNVVVSFANQAGLPVPEPTSLSLLATAFAAGWLRKIFRA